MENITVNGKPLKQHLSDEDSKEVHEFYLFELQMVGVPSGKYRTRSSGLVRCPQHSYKKTTGCQGCYPHQRPMIQIRRMEVR